jgi:hypothetical protein
MVSTFFIECQRLDLTNDLIDEMPGLNMRVLRALPLSGGRWLVEASCPDAPEDADGKVISPVFRRDDENDTLLVMSWGVPS